MQRGILDDVLTQKPNLPLYHYTTQAGLLGILRSKEIWASHTQYLNDAREGLHALEMVREEIKALRESSTDVGTSAILDEMDLDVRGTAGGGVRAIDGNVCVCSFSEDRDSLSQWRAYSPDGSGFAIGVPGACLGKVVDAHQFYLARCIYDEERQREVVRALVEEVAAENAARRAGPSSGGPLLPTGGNLHAYLHRYAPLLKHPAFRGEREWRVISRPLSCSLERFCFREGRSMVIPYYRLPLGLQGTNNESLQLYEIVVGPTPNPELSVRSVRSLLVRIGLGDTLVNSSKVPYRHW